MNEQNEAKRPWTPGPWSVIQRFDVISDRLRMIVQGSRDIESDDASEANARLVSAAPDFADGTEDFIAYEKAMDDGDDVRAMVLYASASKKLRAAMNKAMGVNGG